MLIIYLVKSYIILCFYPLPYIVLYTLPLTGSHIHKVYWIIILWFTPIATSSYVFVGLYLFFFGLITISVTITLLVITVCYIKHLTVLDIRLEEAIVKLGFFLLLGNGISLLGQFVPPLIVTLVILQPARLDAPPIPAGVTYSAYTLLNAALIPTPFWFLSTLNPFSKDCATACFSADLL